MIALRLGSFRAHFTQCLVEAGQNQRDRTEKNVARMPGDAGGRVSLPFAQHPYIPGGATRCRWPIINIKSLTAYRPPEIKSFVSDVKGRSRIRIHFHFLSRDCIVFLIIALSLRRVQSL